MLNPVVAEEDFELAREEPTTAGCSLEASTRFSLLPSRDREQRSILTALPPVLRGAHPALRAQTHQKATLVVSSISSEEKLEEHQRFLENPKEQILFRFTSPGLDTKIGQPAAAGRLSLLHN